MYRSHTAAGGDPIRECGDPIRECRSGGSYIRDNPGSDRTVRTERKISCERHEGDLSRSVPFPFPFLDHRSTTPDIASSNHEVPALMEPADGRLTTTSHNPRLSTHSS